MKKTDVDFNLKDTDPLIREGLAVFKALKWLANQKPLTADKLGKGKTFQSKMNLDSQVNISF